MFENKVSVCVYTSSSYHNEIIQFNSKTLFKDGDPVSLQLIFPGAIQTCKQIIHTYIQNNTGSSDKHRQTQLTLSYNY